MTPVPRHPPRSLPAIVCSASTSCSTLKCWRIRIRFITNCEAKDPVHWDSFLHAWVVTRYADVVHVLHHYSADRTPTPEQLSALNLSALNPIAAVMVRQMLFLDPPDHTRLRALASAAFTPRRVEQLRVHIDEIMNTAASMRLFERARWI